MKQAEVKDIKAVQSRQRRPKEQSIIPNPNDTLELVEQNLRQTRTQELLLLKDLNVSGVSGLSGVRGVMCVQLCM